LSFLALIHGYLFDRKEYGWCGRGTACRPAPRLTGRAGMRWGGTVAIPMAGTVYVGVAVCAHNSAALSTATFVLFPTRRRGCPLGRPRSPGRRVSAPGGGGLKFAVAAPARGG
jgi:hypothetical protein